MTTPSNNKTKSGVVTRFGRWLFSWRTIRRAFIALVGLVTLVGLLVTEENWRGKRAWENYKRQREAKGERFGYASIAPPPVPDDQNFFAAPIVSQVFAGDQAENPGMPKLFDVKPADRIDLSIYRGDSKIWPTTGGSWQKGTFTDLTQWQQYFRRLAESDPTNAFPVPSQPKTPAADVLLALSTFDPVVEELRKASQRPYARLPLNYENGFQEAARLLPVLAGVKRCTQLIELRTIAELQSSQSQKALDDTKLLLRVMDSLRKQPFLISHLVRIAVMAYTIQPIYEGLAQHRWSEPQLIDLQNELAKLDFLADYQTAMQGEKMCGIEAFENQRITRQMQTYVQESGATRVETVSLRLMPSAYFYQNELSIARLQEQFVLPLVDLTNRIVSPAAQRSAEAAVEVQRKSISRFSPYKLQALMIFPAISKSVSKFASAQVSVDLARVACALERYRLAHGQYPESLDALAPQFIDKLPHDIVNGQTLHYRRADDGRFVLYSVGWNEKDDGGVVAVTKSGRVDSEKGDWVWKYPAQ